MNFIYKVRKIENSNRVPLHTNSTLCRLSSKNIIAFCLVDEPDSKEKSLNNIYVSDLLSPWIDYKVASTKNEVQVLEWNPTGDWLLIAEGGFIKLWCCRNQVLNSWSLAYIVNIQSEKIVNCKFFHNGKKINFNSHKRDCLNYAEKFERVKYKPTVQKFGKVASEGCIILTSSGLLGVFFIPYVCQSFLKDELSPDHCNIEIRAVTHSLGLVRNYIQCSAISYCSNGGFRIAVCGSKDKLVHCFNVSIKYHDDGNPVVSRESLPSIFLFENYRNSNSFNISHIKWAIIDNEELILITYHFEKHSIIEQWNLIKNKKSIHKFLQKNKVDVLQTEYWEHMARTQLPTELTDLCLSKQFLDNQCIYLLLKDNTIQIMEAGLKKVGVLPMTKYLDEKQKNTAITALDISFMDHVLVLLNTNGDLYALQICNRYIDLQSNVLLANQSSFLEYCIVTGFDASDILLLQIGNVDVLIEKLTENFMRQPSYVRQYYYSNFLAAKSNMCRMYFKQNDFDNLIILHSISIAFKSLLRPSDLSCHDKGPAENLSIVLSDALPDVDKVLFNLDAKDFTVEPLTLQSLQQLIQWVADLTLNILNKLSEDTVKNKSKKQCYELSKDCVALNSIRELLAMIRIWGLLNSQCLPIYTKSIEHVDVLSVLFRLLTRLAQNPMEPDEMLIDECVILSSQVLIPNYKFSNFKTLLNGYFTPLKSFPIIFTKTLEPTMHQEMDSEAVMYENGTKDGVSNILLGSSQNHLKECIRCGFYNSAKNVAKTSAMRAWYQRWISCRCGGYWKLI